MTGAADRLTALYQAAVTLIGGRPELAQFAGPLPSDPERRPLVPQRQPVQAILAELPSDDPVVTALQAASHDLRWNVSYSEDEVGPGFLETYGWVDLLSPHGPFVHQGARIMLGYWGPGLHYPLHWHAAAEVYVPLYGSAEFQGESYGSRVEGPGAAVFHVSNEKHAAIMGPEGLLALAIWTGADTRVAPTIQAHGGGTYQVREVGA